MENCLNSLLSPDFSGVFSFPATFVERFRPLRKTRHFSMKDNPFTQLNAFIDYNEGGLNPMLRSIRDGDKLLVGLDGELDHFCAQSIRRELDTYLNDLAIRHLILDFSGLTFMDSSGIGVILGRYRILRERGGALSVIHMNPQVARIFHMSGLNKIIRQLDQKQEAVR